MAYAFWASQFSSLPVSFITPCNVCDLGEKYHVELKISGVDASQLGVEVKENGIWITITTNGKKDFVRMIELESIDVDSVDAEISAETLFIQAYKLGVSIPTRVAVTKSVFTPGDPTRWTRS